MDDNLRTWNYHYVLDAAGEPVPEPDLMKWAEWMGQPGARVVRQDTLPDETRVSTVFLGLDHGLGIYKGKCVPPVLWETMIFGGPHDQFQSRYSSREMAVFGHELALKLAKGEITETQMEEAWEDHD